VTHASVAAPGDTNPSDATANVPSLKASRDVLDQYSQSNNRYSSATRAHYYPAILVVKVYSQPNTSASVYKH